MLNAGKLSEMMGVQNLAGMDRFSKRTVKEELDRSKLIHLISTTDYSPERGAVKTIGSQFTTEFIEAIADHLIANGVTVTTGISIECKYVDKDGIPQTISRMYKVPTNADRIRAMSDEELAVFLESSSTSLGIRLGGDYIVRAAEYIKIWLKQPAEVK